LAPELISLRQRGVNGGKLHFTEKYGSSLDSHRKSGQI
jgi:hypothetical protein